MSEEVVLEGSVFSIIALEKVLLEGVVLEIMTLREEVVDRVALSGKMLNIAVEEVMKEDMV